MRDESTTMLKDIAIEAGERSPIDGVVVRWERYTHLLLCENQCEP